MSARTNNLAPSIAAAPPRAVLPAAAAKFARDLRPTVLHFIPGIGGGGAEAMLRNLVAATRGGAWRTVIVALDARQWPEQAAALRGLSNGFHDLESEAYLRTSVLRRLRRIIRAERPDVVQTWMHHADLFGGLCARSAGVRNIVWSIHGCEVHRNPGDGNLKSWIFRTLLSAASRLVPRRIVSCSAAAIRDHAAIGYPIRKMRWIPNGICCDAFVPDAARGAALRGELGIPANAPLVGYAGRFHPMKQLETFLGAVAIQGRRMPEARFILCGGTPEDFDANSRAAWEELPLKSRVHFIPFRADMERYYPALSLFSLSSRTEAFPMTLLEAMACGVPCAATDVGDCAAIIGDARCVAPPCDAAALASVWNKILSLDEADRARLGQDARTRIEENFTIIHTAHQYESIYADLVAPRV